jgi:hypothetical protein
MNERRPESSPMDEQDENPYRSPQVRYEGVAELPDPPPIELEDNDGAALRAWRAAVIGLLLCLPLLNFYSAWLLLLIALGDRPLSARGRRHCRFAAAIDVAACMGSGGAILFILG